MKKDEKTTVTTEEFIPNKNAKGISESKEYFNYEFQN